MTDKKEILRMRESGMTYQQIANVVGVSRQAICSRINYYSNKRSKSPRIFEDVSENTLHVLSCIVNYFEEHGYAPSIREICELTGLKSTQSVHYQIQKLFNHGYIDTDHGFGSPRAFRVTEDGIDFVSEYIPTK